MSRLESLRRALRVLLPALLLGVVGRPAVASPAADPIHFSIEAGAAPDTLRKFAEQSGLQLLFKYDDMVHLRTSAVSGDFDPIVALEQMIRGANISYRLVNDHTVTLTPRHAPKADRVREGVESSRGELGAPEPRGHRALHHLETVTIRGSVERVTAPEGNSLVTLTREDIDLTRAITTQQVLRTVPQIFGGGPSEDTHEGYEAQTNASRGSGVNLRALGAGSTLVLVNGRRMAGGGTDGAFVDVSSIPLSIVERIEILPDSFSTRYGADAVGGVVNFVLKKESFGAQTDVHLGTSTRSALHEEQVSQVFGMEGGASRGLLALDYYHRESLPAADRRQARSDLSIFGGDNFDTSQSNPGTIFLGSTTWAIPHDQDGTDLLGSSLVAGTRNLVDRQQGADLLPMQTRFTLYGTSERSLTEGIKLSADLMYTQRDVHAVTSGARATLFVPSTNGFFVNPTTLPVAGVLVGYDFTADLGVLTSVIHTRTTRAGIGMEFDLGDVWHVTEELNFASEQIDSRVDNSVDTDVLPGALSDPNRETALNVFGDGSHTNPATLARLRRSSVFASTSRLLSGSISASRALPSWSGQDGTVTLGADLRRYLLASTWPGSSSAREATVRCTFLTLTLPVLDPLTLLFGERYEHYSDFGTRGAPLIGVTWAPSKSLSVRASWSRSLRPPNLADLDESGNFLAVTAVRDPRVPGGLASVLVRSGKNANLHEERAQSWTAGLDFTPTALPSLSLALTYFDTNFRDRRSVPAFGQDLLVNPAMTDLIVRDPSPAQLEEVCKSAVLLGSGASCSSLPIAAIADLRVRNRAYVHTNGADLLTRYTNELGPNSLNIAVSGTYIISFKSTESPSSAPIELVSTQSNPIDLRLQGSVEWRHRSATATLRLSYDDRYRDIASARPRSVSSWTTADLSLAYKISAAQRSWLADATLALSATNVFDRDPPFLNNQIGIGYDQENGDLTGRTVTVSLRQHW